ncbi:hypothetical protein RFI_28757 [Reticulomyxa filosa]|uniref:Uncharacterized protein n=1 Tax=Reticulomyxa filosa TaxID=46433 RepID=X6M3S8_RETFI|nr:hypothetical protein RFI_28757 [Reticulomyxa filosa]|eukprot:ETO08633.1 hypothetical protein RFI_28757 [Reticulomyxa filosa]
MEEPVLYYCRNGHPLLFKDTSSPLHKEAICQIDGCGAKVFAPSSKASPKTEGRSTGSKSIWFVIERFYTSPKRIEPTTLSSSTWLLLRLLYHLPLLLRGECIPQDSEKLKQLVQGGRASDVLWCQVKHDLKQLEGVTGLNEELLEVALHSWIKHFSDKFEKWYPNGLPPFYSISLEDVYKFEEKLDKECMAFFKDKDKNRRDERAELRKAVRLDDAVPAQHCQAAETCARRICAKIAPEEFHHVCIDDVMKQRHECKLWWNELVLCWNSLAVVASNSKQMIIIRLLEDEHNRFLNTFYCSKRRSTHEQKKEEEEEISLHDNDKTSYKWFLDITQGDILCFDKEKLNCIIRRHFIPLLEYGAIKDSHYLQPKCFDFASIENDIYHTFIKSLWEHTHLSTISPMQKQKALEALNNAIVFLFNDLDQLHLDTPLTDLFQQLQFEKKDQSLFFIRSHAKSDCTTLCIKHIGALWRVLNNLVRSERLHDDFIAPFVLEMYRHSLPNELQKQVKGFVKKTPLTTMKEVLDAWREIAYKQGQIERKQSNPQEFQLEWKKKINVSCHSFRNSDQDDSKKKLLFSLVLHCVSNGKMMPKIRLQKIKILYI